MHLNEIAPFPGKRVLRVVIETPRGSRNKYDYDPKLAAIVLKKSLPEGMVFPLAFGFIPRTLAPDGDPLDVLVLMDEPTYPGCVVDCNLVGVMQAEQRERGGKRERNDRFIAVAQSSLEFHDVRRPKDLPCHIMNQLEQFFVSYNKLEGRQFKPLGVAGRKVALDAIKAHRVKSR